MSEEYINYNEIEDMDYLCELLEKKDSILKELEEYLQNHIEEWGNSEDEYMMGVIAEDKDILNKLKEKYK